MPQNVNSIIASIEARGAFYAKRGHRCLTANDMEALAWMAEFKRHYLAGEFPDCPFVARQKKLKSSASD